MAVYFIVSLSLSTVYCVTVLAMFARCWTPTALYCKDDVNSVSYTIEKEKYELRHHAPIQSNHKLERRRRRRRRFRYAEDDEENRPTSCQRPRPLRFCGRRRGKKKKQINDARSTSWQFTQSKERRLDGNSPMSSTILLCLSRIGGKSAVVFLWTTSWLHDSITSE